MKAFSRFSLLLLVLVTASCKFNDPNQLPDTETQHASETKTETTLPDLAPSLAAQLKEKKDAFMAKAPQEKIDSYEAGLQAIRDAGVPEMAINTTDTAPDFTLSNALGESVSLKEQLANGPVVLTWYRGGWCPYCNITLHYLQEQLPKFKMAGATLIALTPEVPDSSLSTAEKHSLEFEVLSDVGNKVAREYGIVFDLTPDVAQAYQKSFDLEAFNGDDSYQLPLAATYIIDTNGIVRYAFIDADYRNRAEPMELLKVLSLLKEGI